MRHHFENIDFELCCRTHIIQDERSLAATTHCLLVVFVVNKHDFEWPDFREIKLRHRHSPKSPTCNWRQIADFQLGCVPFITGGIVIIVIIEYIDMRLYINMRLL